MLWCKAPNRKKGVPAKKGRRGGVAITQYSADPTYRQRYSTFDLQHMNPFANCCRTWFETIFVCETDLLGMEHPPTTDGLRKQEKVKSAWWKQRYACPLSHQHRSSPCITGGGAPPRSSHVTSTSDWWCSTSLILTGCRNGEHLHLTRASPLESRVSMSSYGD